MSNLSYDGVLLDLDGTLADTAPDMGAALNALLSEEDHEPLPFSRIRPVVSHGARGLLQLGFGEAVATEREAELRGRFLSLYEGVLCNGTTLFPGVAEVLERLESWHVPWGVVTNKPAYLTEPLLEQLQLRQRATCVVSGDTVAKAKPHPWPLYHAAAALDRHPRHCLYVGDAERDIMAGRAAGMDTLIAAYGYIAANDRPESWRAKGSIDHPTEILSWVDGAFVHAG